MKNKNPQTEPKPQDDDDLARTDPEGYWEDCIYRAVAKYSAEYRKETLTRAIVELKKPSSKEEFETVEMFVKACISLQDDDDAGIDALCETYGVKRTEIEAST